MNNESMGNMPENTGQNPYQPWPADGQSSNLPPLPAPAEQAGTQPPQFSNPSAANQAPQYGQPQPMYGQPEAPGDMNGMNGMNAMPPLPETNEQHEHTAKRRRRNGWIVGISAAVVIVLALGAWGVLALTSRAGADTPEHAAAKLLRSAGGFDIVTVSQVVTPSELGVVSGPIQEVMKSGGGGNPGAGIPGVQSAVQELNAAGNVSLENFNTETTEITDGVVAVHVQSGELVIEGDSKRYQSALTDLQRAVAYEQALMDGATEEEAADRAKTDVEPVTDVTLPQTINLANLNELEPNAPDVKLNLVAVKEDGRWFISPVMSLFETISASNGDAVKHGDEILPAHPAKTPEEAGMQFLDSLFNDVMAASQGSGTFKDTISSLAFPERRVLSIYLLPLLKEVMGNGGGPSGFGIPKAEFSGEFERVKGSGDIMVLPKDVTMSIGGQPQINLSGVCISWPTGGGTQICLDDAWTGFEALGLDKLGLVVVKEDGGYVVSIYDTVRVWMQTASENYLKLRDAGELDQLRG